MKKNYIFGFVLIVCILVVVLYIDDSHIIPIYVIDKNYEGYKSKKKTTRDIKILNLVLYSQNDEYEKMKVITENYYKNFDYVTTVYYLFSENQVEPYRLDGNILYIKGTETYVPGITDKTKKAIQYFKDDYNKYNYLIRTNVSTIINFDLLVNELDKTPIDYGSGLTWHLEKVVLENDKREVIYDVNYASGTSIIMSRKVVDKLIQNIENIKLDTIDDVALGIFVKEHLPDVRVTNFLPEKFLFVSDTKGNRDELKKLVKKDDYIYYRNRTEDRKTDVSQMRDIVDIL